MRNKIRIGTCSWKYESWRGLVYPEFGEFNYLEEYSKLYHTVEIDQWFWSLHGNKVTLPIPKVVNNYNSSTPEDFRFTIKVPNSITLTHHYKSNDKNKHFLSSDLMDSFCSSIKPIQNKIGMLIFQFEYLNKQKIDNFEQFEKKFTEFRKCIDESIPIGIEIRNPNYLSSRYFDFLNDIKTSMVFLQGYYMPNITDVFKNYNSKINSSVVIRLHGFDRKGIEQKTNKIWNKIVESKDAELKSIIEMIVKLQTKKNDVYINVNNHYEGSAPLTISKIKKLLGLEIDSHNSNNYSN
ncbi:MAG: DUF72 domain-containing protein [Melioribacteraceae bacterium]